MPTLSLQRSPPRQLLAGRRCGNTPGRSLFVRSERTRKRQGRAGKWVDAAPENLAICSTLSARHVVSTIFAMWSLRRGAFSAFRKRRLNRIGSGISANLADKARKLGIPVWKFEEGGA